MYSKDFISDEFKQSLENTVKSVSESIRGIQESMIRSLRKISESIDWDYLEDLNNSEEENIVKMAENGWTISPNFGLGDHMIIKNLNDFDEINKAFMQLYNHEEYSIYSDDVSYIRDNINEKHKELFDQCVKCYEQGDYAIAIPSLLAILEGTCAEIINSPKIGKELIRQFKSTLNDEKYIFETAKLSLFTLLEKYILVSKDFSDERSKGINRNWVLHGRDDARLWDKSDTLKLINNLSTALFLSED